MRIAVVQMELEREKGDNLAKALSYIEQSAGCDLIVFPEMLMGKRREGVELTDLAENIETGEFAKALKRAAAESDIDVCACLWEESKADKVYNTAVVYGADGNIKAKYRKLHLFDALSVKESDFMISGDEFPPVFECAGVKCGLSICYDLRFPEIYRSMAGAEVMLVPAAWYSGDMKVEHLRMLLGARAMENTSYALCANLCGDEFAGNSAVYTPFGELKAEADLSEKILKVEIDTDYLNSVREKLPCLDSLRRDIF